MKVQTENVNYNPNLVVRAWEGTKSICAKVAKTASNVFDAIFPKNPVTKHRQFRVIPTWVENDLGNSLYDGMCPKGVTKYNDVVNRVGQRLAAQSDRTELNFEFRVEENDRVINAYCLPGGKIAITTGLIRELEKDLPFLRQQKTFEDRLAAVLGHEITHACAAHGAMRMQLGGILFVVGKVAQFALTFFVARKIEENQDENDRREAEAAEREGRPIRYRRRRRDSEVAWETGKAAGQLFDLGWSVASSLIQHKHSRCNEFQSDVVGMKYAKKAGFDPAASIWLQEMFAGIHGETKEPNKSFLKLFSTHPPSLERVEKCRETLALIEADKLEEIC